MYAAVRSPIAAGVALVGAAAIAVSPIAAAPLDIHLPALELTAMSRQGLINPIDAFAPVVKQALADTQTIIDKAIANPFPILRAVVANQTSNAFDLIQGLGGAAVILGNGAFNTPAAVNTAARQVLAGDLQGALATLSSVTVVPLAQATGEIVLSIEGVIKNQLAIAQRLSVAVPEAAMGVVVATLNCITQTSMAVSQAGMNVLAAAATLRPVAVANAITTGAVNVASVFERTTIGQEDPIKTQLEAVSPAIARQTPSIATAINRGGLEIANAIVPQKRVQAAVAPAAATASVVAAPAVTAPSATAPSASAKSAAPKSSTSKLAAAVRHDVQTSKTTKATHTGSAAKK
jgi:hypothetical protein